MRVAVTEFVTLDGVSRGPGSAAEDTGDGFARGGWLVPHLDETFVRCASVWLDPAAATGPRLVRHEATPHGLLLLGYEVTGAAPVGDYGGVADPP